jgi:hypothetical protein
MPDFLIFLEKSGFKNECALIVVNPIDEVFWVDKEEE